MSAVPRAEPPLLLPLSVAQLDAVLAIEMQAYDFPWTRGNFIDSLAAGYWARALYAIDIAHGARAGAMIGYIVAMPGVEEMHLLNVTVALACQGRGHARFMLDALYSHARMQGGRRLWLEVRVSNERARALYESQGYHVKGVRKGYYPAPRGQREDALVMGLELYEATGELD